MEWNTNRVREQMLLAHLSPCQRERHLAFLRLFLPGSGSPAIDVTAVCMTRRITAGVPCAAVDLAERVLFRSDFFFVIVAKPQ
jgi:hypothetical protein